MLAQELSHSGEVEENSQLSTSRCATSTIRTTITTRGTKENALTQVRFFFTGGFLSMPKQEQNDLLADILTVWVGGVIMIVNWSGVRLATLLVPLGALQN